MSWFQSSIFTRGCAVLALTILAACGGRESGVGGKARDMVALLPSDNLPSGTMAEEQARVYAGRELYDYIDGGADLFLEFGFVEAAVRQYKSPAGDDITAAVYRMEDPEAAFGVFSVNRRGASNPAKMGSIGARSDFEYLFCHGDYYVQAQSTGTDSLTARAIDEICSQIDSGLAGESTEWPEALKLLPRRGFVPHSEVYLEGPLALNSRRFISDENLLALSDSIPGAMASFMVRPGGHPAIYLVIEYPDSAFARGVFDKLEQHYSSTAEQERSQDQNLQFSAGDDRIIFSSARKMDALVLRGIHLTGMFENITAGHGGNPHGGGMGGMVNPHGTMPGGMVNPHGDSGMPGQTAPNPQDTN